MIRTYLDWLIAVPWAKRSEDRLDPVEARRGPRRRPRRPRRREGAHHRVPRRAQAARRARRAGRPALRRHPDPHRSAGNRQDVDRRVDRPGHRAARSSACRSAACATRPRSAVIAGPTSARCPGRLVRALRDAGTMNPVIMLDEVDKIGADWRGDPSSALLEVLDPAQNHSFRDHYLDVELDLSQVLFIATANVADTIPGPLLDRMEIHPLRRLHDAREGGHRARLSLAAAGRAQRAPTGRGHRSTTTSCALVVTDYTREAGVRQLERELGTLLRKIATRIDVRARRRLPSRSTWRWCATRSGRQKFFQEAVERTAVPGVATGLAVTGTGRRRALRRGGGDARATAGSCSPDSSVTS